MPTASNSGIAKPSKRRRRRDEESEARTVRRQVRSAPAIDPASSPSAWPHAGGESKSNQFRQVAGAGFVHQSCAMDLHRARADREIVGDCFARQSGEETLQHLTLPRREQRELGGCRDFTPVLLVPLPKPRERDFKTVDDCFRGEWL